MSNNDNILTIRYRTDKNRFRALLNTMAHLNKLGDHIRMKFLGNELMLYSALPNMNSVKCSFIPMDDFALEYDPTDIIDFVAINSKSLVKSGLMLLNDKYGDIIIDILYDKGRKIGNEMRIYESGMELILNFLGGDGSIVKNLTKEQIMEKTEPSIADYSFIMTGEQYDEVRKLASTSDDEVINLNASKNKVYMGNKRWKLKIADIPNVPEGKHVITKKYFSLISPAPEINVFIHYSYMHIQQDSNYFILGFEIQDTKSNR